jgi:hypothetical protein
MSPKTEGTAQTLAESRRRELLAGLDPLLVEAAAEVDRALLRWSLAQTPLERLRGCTEATRTLAKFHRAPPSPG